MKQVIEVQLLTAEEVAQAELQTAWEELQAVPSYVERKQEEEMYFCGLCGQHMPINHFPH